MQVSDNPLLLVPGGSDLAPSITVAPIEVKIAAALSLPENVPR